MGTINRGKTMPILSALPPPALLAACVMPPRVKVFVTARIDSWDIHPTADTAELDRMARETGMGGKHRPFGFYMGEVASAVTADIGNAAKDPCQGPVTIRLTMRLTSRHIGVAKDIQSSSCRFARIVAHYRHHADADEAVFQRYVLKVTAALSETRASLLSGSDGAADAQAGILEAADAVIEPVLAEMDAARASARLAVDTPGKVEKLDSACGEGI
jgi:hypothetical protein